MIGIYCHIIIITKYDSKPLKVLETYALSNKNFRLNIFDSHSLTLRSYANALLKNKNSSRI